jgi:sugar phosphate isomerase/epimerase
MAMKVSCVTASYVADLLDYPGAVDWAEAQRRIEEAPLLETVDGLLDRLLPAGLDGIEFWYPHVAPTKLTPALASAIKRRLAAHGWTCCACAGGLPDPRQDPQGCEEFFQVARMMGAPLIAGHAPAPAVPYLAPLCAAYGVSLGYENGTEGDAAQIRTIVESGDEWIGANLDTGNLAAQGGDPVGAVHELADRLIHVHLKDVPAVGSHTCVALGSGIVDIEGVLDALCAIGYEGWLSVEIETGDQDPTDDIIASAETVRRFLGAR